MISDGRYSPEDAERPPSSESGRIPFCRKSVAAFVGRTETGPVDEAVTLRNYNEFRKNFGGHASFSFVSYAVQQFFLHGGKQAVVVRVANRANRALIRVPAQGDTLELEARQPGSREFIRVSIDYDEVEDERSRFNLVVQRLHRPASQLVEDQELYAGVSIDPDDRRNLADALAESRLVRLRGALPRWRPDPTRANMPGDPIPYLEAAVRGSDGAELTDYDLIGSNREGTGIFALDAVDNFDLLCLPPPPGADYGITTFLAAERYCERRHAMLVWDPPASWEDVDSALANAKVTNLRSKNALTYFPRVRSRVQRVGLPSVLPACGALAGILAAKDAFGDWRESYESDPLLKISLAPIAEVDEARAASLIRAGVNVFVPTQYGGSVLRGNTTLAASDSLSGLWKRLDRRRLLWFMLDSLEAAGCLVLEGEFEAGSLLEARILEFLEGLREAGALPGANAGQAYFVRRLAGDDDGAVRMRVGFALQTPNELLTYDLAFTPSQISSTRISVLESEQMTG